MALVTTPGAATANSYATWVEYKAYWGARLFNTVPLAATQAQAEIALQWACLLLSSLFQWTGSAADAVQCLPWPRKGMQSLNGFALLSTVIPIQLKNAQCEWAGKLLSADLTADNAALKTLSSESLLTGLTAGPVSLSFNAQTFDNLESFSTYAESLGPAYGYISKSVPDGVRLLLVPSWYIRKTGKTTIVFEVMP